MIPQEKLDEIRAENEYERTANMPNREDETIRLLLDEIDLLRAVAEAADHHRFRSHPVSAGCSACEEYDLARKAWKEAKS